MRKTLVIALGAAAALVTAAVAVAAFTATGVSTTTATFSTDKATDVRTRTCTGADGKEFKLTNGRYTGTADFTNPALDLDGALTIRAHTTYSTADGLGWVEGSFKVRDDDSRLSGKFAGTLKGDQLVGFLTASSRGHHAKVLGNLSGTFVPGGTGFSSGLIGSTSSTQVLAVIAGPVCKGHVKPVPKPKPAKPAKPAPAPKPVRPVQVSGVVTGLSTSEIVMTSKGPTTTKCAIVASSPATAGALDKRAEMKCEFLGTAPNQVWTLTALHLHR